MRLIEPECGGRCRWFLSANLSAILYTLRDPPRHSERTSSQVN